MNTTWRLSSYESMTDVKELIPEFFRGSDAGQRVPGEVCAGLVVLPVGIREFVTGVAGFRKADVFQSGVVNRNPVHMQRSKQNCLIVRAMEIEAVSSLSI